MNFTVMEIISGKMQQTPGKRKRRDSVDQRDYHNALERKRRELIATKFKLLQDCIPLDVTGTSHKNDRISRCFVLNAACAYVKTLEQKKELHAKDIKKLKDENEILKAKIKEAENGNMRKEDLKLLLLHLQQESIIDEKETATENILTQLLHTDTNRFDNDDEKVTAKWYSGEGYDEYFTEQ